MYEAIITLIYLIFCREYNIGYLLHVAQQGRIGDLHLMRKVLPKTVPWVRLNCQNRLGADRMKYAEKHADANHVGLGRSHL